MTSATSPAASGPAGAHFEGQVGAHYLLSLLIGTEPRGLPSTIIDRVELQRAPEGRALDDVIVYAHDGRGYTAILEIQVKRSITFAPTDAVFQAVVAQMVEASRGSDFWNSRYELAIAIARTSHKIDGAYQDVLTWARQLGDAATFIARIERPGSANDDMRTFLRTFRSHLRDAGAPDDDGSVWRLLRRLQILVFDFTAQGSASEELAKERAVRALHPDDTPRAGSLWASLIELALQVAASGGDRTRDRLIEDLTRQSYRMAGDRRYSSARMAIAEDSRHALEDIADQVGEVTLTRHERIAAVHAALDEGRYVEIRGDAGVGKSGVLKHFAMQLAAEARVIVLSPGRTTPRGWTAMRAVIGFDGTARELLSDLAADGAAALFLDGFDMFDEEERRTVVDLVREASKVPGFTVIGTARRNFGIEEPNWLPADALDQLGRAAPVLIGELNEAEVDELRYAAPQLVALLADNHPARDVTRNLYRLARLVRDVAGAPVPRTEVDMAKQWWRTADGRPDRDYRERARLLKALAEQALSRTEPLDVSDRPASAVDALVGGKTLRDLGGDRVTFRHDVLREWAIANLLFSEPDMFGRLPLAHPAPGALARGVELAARMAIEGAPDGARWRALLEMLSRDNAHGSWRRVVLLALVRSEVGVELLTRISEMLVADRASLLRELIRTVMAVDVEPASKWFAIAGVDSAMIPASLNVPSGPSWYRLIRWLLGLGEQLPMAAIPEVVAFYTAWSTAMLGRDLLTPELLRWFYRWLTEIETAGEVRNFRDWREPFGGEIDRDQIGPLEQDLRGGFLLFCYRNPTLAAEYLRSVRQRRHGDTVVSSILKFRGTLAQAAPAELADLTAAALIPQRRPEGRDLDHSEIREPFDFLDHELFPPSATQGPFLELLIYATEHGLSLVRRLVDHAISFYSKGRRYNSDVIIIPFGDGERAFPWRRSYAWSREGQAPNSVTSALMALEAWAHGRIEADEPFESVLADVLRSPGAPAAYLLVAVDLMLSHWPKSREVAVPFLACPELLCLDRERQQLDSIESPDFFGLKALQKMAGGAASLDSLKQRPSRRRTLEELIGNYAIFGPEDLRTKLTELLRHAAARLGPPGAQSNLGDPAFMVVHALNLADPNNWHEVAVASADGTQRTVHQYMSPKAENRHLMALREASRDRFADADIQAAIGVALEDPSRSSPELATRAVAWAQNASATAKTKNTDEDWMREQAIVTAAMIAMRDGDTELRARHKAWARDIFAHALLTEEDPVHRVRSGLRFNPIAIAFVGMIHLLKDHITPEDLRAILNIAARDNPAAAHGFAAAAATLADVDERLPRAVLRCAFAACIVPGSARDLSDDERSARAERQRQRVRAAVDAELAWLAGGRTEPDWPTFPPAQVRPRHRLRIPDRREPQKVPDARRLQPEQRTDHQAAALWLRSAASLIDLAKRPWTCELVRTFASWTATANGAWLDPDEELADPPREWNDAYFNFLAHCLSGWTSSEIDQLALALISSLPDEPFFDIVTSFLRSVDAVYFTDQHLQEAEAIRNRAVLARRMMASHGWRRLGGSRSSSIERHIGPAIATFFFNDYGYIQPLKCYLLPKGVDRLEPFIPVLEELVKNGPYLFVALAALNLLEVSPRLAHLPFVVMMGKTWLASYSSDSSFWVDHGIGRRLCALIDGLRLQDQTLLNPEHALRYDIDVLLAGLVRLGVPEAARLETALMGP